jgi:diadenosine tetraphosphate (Ap4A) HIT family hydrolase
MLKQEGSPECVTCTSVIVTPPELIVAENLHWVAAIDPKVQTLLATTVFTAKRHAQEIDDLRPDEDDSFRLLRNCVMQAIRAEFDPIGFDTMSLQNNLMWADLETPVPETTHVKQFLIARYDNLPTEFGGISFDDPNTRWPLTRLWPREFKAGTPAAAVPSMVAGRLAARVVSAEAA